MDSVAADDNVRGSARRFAGLGHPARVYASAATLAYVLMEVRTMNANGRGIRERAPKGERAYVWACEEIECRAGSIESMLRGRLLDIGVDPGRSSEDAANAWRALNEAVYLAGRE